MKNYNELSEDNCFSSFDKEGIDVKIKFGKINSKIDIYIKGKESGEPHIHLHSENGEDDIRIRLKENKFDGDAYEPGKKLILSASICKSLDKYMRKIEIGSKRTNWEVLCDTWNMINYQNPNKINIETTKQPSYLDIEI